MHVHQVHHQERFTHAGTELTEVTAATLSVPTIGWSYRLAFVHWYHDIRDATVLEGEPLRLAPPEPCVRGFMCQEQQRVLR